jgi:hypothetical protein
MIIFFNKFNANYIELSASKRNFLSGGDEQEFKVQLPFMSDFSEIVFINGLVLASSHIILGFNCPFLLVFNLKSIKSLFIIKFRAALSPFASLYIFSADKWMLQAVL